MIGNRNGRSPGQNLKAPTGTYSLTDHSVVPRGSADFADLTLFFFFPAILRRGLTLDFKNCFSPINAKNSMLAQQLQRALLSS